MSGRLVARVNYEDVKPIPYRKTLTHVNTFIIKTTEFLNRFSYLCEERLRKVTRDIERLDVMLRILEEKLKSIPGIENAPLPDMPSAPAPVSAGESTVKETPVAPAAVAAPPVAPPAAAAAVAAPAPPPVAPESAPPVQAETLPSLRDDPRYAKYFSMVDKGIPVAHVQQKMVIDGIDPKILLQGNGPATAGTSVAAAVLPVAAPVAAPESSEADASSVLPPVPDTSRVEAPPPPPAAMMREPEDPLQAAVARRARKMAEAAAAAEGGAPPPPSLAAPLDVSVEGPLPPVPSASALSRVSLGGLDLSAPPPPLPRDSELSFSPVEGSLAGGMPPPPPPPQLLALLDGPEDDIFDDDDDDASPAPPAAAAAAPALFMPPPPPVGPRAEDSLDADDSF